MEDIAEINKRKYLVPPPQAKIDKVINRYRVSDYQFERFFGIPKGTIKVVRHGEIKLPAKYWHLFYERQSVRKKQSVKKVENKPAETVKESVKKIPSLITHSRLDLL